MAEHSGFSWEEIAQINDRLRQFRSFLARRFSMSHLRDTVFGFDLFISYDFDEVGSFAIALKNSLESQENPLRCFLDREGFNIGDELNAATRRRLLMSRHLAVILSPGAGKPVSWVPHEVEIFTNQGKRNSDRIVPLNVAGSLEKFPLDAKIRRYIPISSGPD
jgi:hypothetical protein